MGNEFAATASSRDPAPQPHQPPPAAVAPAPSATLSAPRVPRRAPPKPPVALPHRAPLKPPAGRFRAENGGRRRAPLPTTEAAPLHSAPAPLASAVSSQQPKPPVPSSVGLPQLLLAPADLTPASPLHPPPSAGRILAMPPALDEFVVVLKPRPAPSCAADGDEAGDGEVAPLSPLAGFVSSDAQLQPGFIVGEAPTLQSHPAAARTLSRTYPCSRLQPSRKASKLVWIPGLQIW